ncbi:MAG: cellulase family glycosylhydrolase [Thermomicrobiales bacterium]
MSKPGKFGKVIVAALVVATVLTPLFAFGAPATAKADTPPPSTTPMDPYFFPDTGHYLSGRFRQYWYDHGGLYVFGLPITKTYMEKSTDGNLYLTQYFERARFEYHPENNYPYDVLLTLLGNVAIQGREGEQPFQPVPDAQAPGGAYSPQTQHNIDPDFLSFWNQYGGLQNFGFPKSEAFQEKNAADGNTYKVQYFERERMESHPEATDPKYKVLLGLLGNEYAAKVGIPDSVRAPETSPPTGSDIPGGAGRNWPAPHLSYGFNAFLQGNSDGAGFNSQTTGMITGAGFNWIRFQLIWRDFEPSKGQYNWGPLDIQVNAAHDAGLKILLSVVKSPDWADPIAVSQGHAGSLPEDLDAFYNTMRVVSGRYAGKVNAYEIWNEQNLAGEVGGHVDVAPYVATLKNGYLGVKKNDPSAAVLFGGLTPTGFKDPSVAIDDTIYLQQFYAYNNGEGKQYYDVLAAHPGSAANLPDWKYPDNPGPGHCSPTAIQRFGAQEGTCWNGGPDFYFRRVEDQRAIMEQNGESGKQIWLTEFGWDACQNLPVPQNYDYCALTSDQQQADNVVRAYQLARDNWPWMGVMFVWNLNYASIPGISQGDEKYGWSVLGPGFAPRPAYDALKNMPK